MQSWDRPLLPERIDDPELPFAELVAALEDVRRVNRWLGADRALEAALDRLAPAPAGRPLRVLDVGSGLGDLPLAVAAWGRKRGRRVEVVGLDCNPRLVEHARKLAADWPELRFVVGDALALPYPDGSFDWVMSHLTLHHLPAAALAPTLRRFERLVAPGGVLWLGDLVGSPFTRALALPFLLLATRTRTGFADGLISVRNALPAQAVPELLQAAGLGYLRPVPAPLGQFAVAGVRPAA